METSFLTFKDKIRIHVRLRNILCSLINILKLFDKLTGCRDKDEDSFSTICPGTNPVWPYEKVKWKYIILISPESFEGGQYTDYKNYI